MVLSSGRLGWIISPPMDSSFWPHCELVLVAPSGRLGRQMPNSCRCSINRRFSLCIKWCECLQLHSATEALSADVVGSAPQSTSANAGRSLTSEWALLWMTKRPLAFPVGLPHSWCPKQHLNNYWHIINRQISAPIHLQRIRVSYSYLTQPQKKLVL